MHPAVRLASSSLHQEGARSLHQMNDAGAKHPNIGRFSANLEEQFISNFGEPFVTFRVMDEHGGVLDPSLEPAVTEQEALKMYQTMVQVLHIFQKETVVYQNRPIQIVSENGAVVAYQNRPVINRLYHKSISTMPVECQNDPTYTCIPVLVFTVECHGLDPL